MEMDLIERMRKAQEEGEQKRLQQLDARTEEEIKREEAVRQLQIETAQRRHSVETEEEALYREKVRADLARIARIADEGE